MSDLFVGSTIAGCRLEAVAGRGGMGVVYRATQLALERPVALKAMAPQLAQDAAYRERFQRESHIAASIDHPNVIPVYEAGELDGTLYLIMRWVEGTDLRALLASCGGLAPVRAARLLRPVASALAAAHRRGLVHRDVKPANVLIARGDGEDDEHIYLTDFGIARRTEGEAAMTRTGVLVGTLDYTAPERIEGGKGNAASDIYAFGCMLFEALTGHVPFDRPTELTRMHAHLNDPVPSAQAEVPAVPERLDAIIAKAMAKRPEARFASAGELSSALGRALEEVETGELAFRARMARAGKPTDETELGDVAEEQPAPAAVATEAPIRLAEPGVEQPLEAALPASTAVDDRPLPPRERARSRRPRALLAAPVVLLAAAAVFVAVLSGGGGAGPHPKRSASTPLVAPTALGPPRVLPGSGSVAVGSPVDLGAGSAPAGLAAQGGSGWVAARGEIVIVRTGAASQPYRVSGNPTSVAVDARGRVWMTGVGPTGVAVLTSSAAKPVHAGRAPLAIAMSEHAAWVASSDSSVTQIDLGSLTGRQIRVQGPIAALGEAYGRIWVASQSGAVTVLDEKNGNIDPIAAPSLPGPAVGIAQSNGVWFLGGSSTLTRVDPRQNLAEPISGGKSRYREHLDQAHIGPQPADIGALAKDNSIWVLSRGDRTLTRIATNGPRNNHAIAKVQFPAPPGQIAVGDHVVWVDIPGTGQVYPITF